MDYVFSNTNIEAVKTDNFLLDLWLRAGNHPDFFLEWNGYQKIIVSKPISATIKQGRGIGATFMVKSVFIKNREIEYVQIKRESMFAFARSKKEFQFKNEYVEDHDVVPGIHFKNKNNELFARPEEFYLNGKLYDIKQRAMLLEYFDYESKDEFLKTSILDYISIPWQVPQCYRKGWTIRRAEKKRLGLEFFNINR